MANNTSVIDESPKFWEADGALRAYSNRSLVIAFIAGFVALIAVSVALAARMQPPTVIRVLPTGEATVVSPSGTIQDTIRPSVLNDMKVAEAPNDYEKEAYVQTFLDNYMNYDQHSLGKNWSVALNMMTTNLRRVAITDMQKNDTVGKLQEEQARSEFKLRTVEASKENPLIYSAFGVRTIHHMKDKSELVDEVVEAYKIRLATAERSARNPTGLFVAEFTATQISGGSKDPQYNAGGK